MGSIGGMEEDLLRRSGVQVRFAAVPAAGLRGRAPWTLARNLAVLANGTRAARHMVRDFRPEVVLVTGGYVSIPVGLAARREGVPLMVFLPDIVPGLAVRFLASFAARVAATTPDSARYLPRRKMVVTGYPVRPAFSGTDRHQARARFGIAAEETLLVVFGGSRGARSINRAVGAGLPAFLAKATVLHICGQEGDQAELAQRAAGLPETLRRRYHLFPYLHDDMPAALLAADLAICRAGASILGELPAAGLPALLVPYPYVHQDENAAYLVRHGAALCLPDRRLRDAGGQPDATALIEACRPLLEDPARRAEMAAAARHLARPEAALRLVEEMRSLARQE